MKAWLLLAWLLAGVGSARAEAGGPLPSGHWDGAFDQPVRVCLDLLPAAGLRLTIFSPAERQPLVIDGSYKLGGRQAGAWLVTLTVATVRTKTLSRCRQYWIATELPATRQLGVEFRPGGTVRLTLRLGCKHQQSTVHLCVLGAGSAATCRDLQSDRAATACAPSPPVRPAIDRDSDAESRPTGPSPQPPDPLDPS